MIKIQIDRRWVISPQGMHVIVFILSDRIMGRRSIDI